MITVEIRSVEVKEREKVIARTQQKRMVREQVGFACMYDCDGTKNPFPTAFMIVLLPGQEPYPAGQYRLSERSIYVNRYSQLEVSPILEPVSA